VLDKATLTWAQPEGRFVTDRIFLTSNLGGSQIADLVQAEWIHPAERQADNWIAQKGKGRRLEAARRKFYLVHESLDKVVVVHPLNARIWTKCWRSD